MNDEEIRRYAIEIYDKHHKFLNSIYIQYTSIRINKLIRRFVFKQLYKDGKSSEFVYNIADLVFIKLESENNLFNIRL